MTKFDFLVQSIADLDISSVELLLDDHRTYQDMPKPKFISRLKAAMDSFEASGNRELIPYSGVCGQCVKGCRGFAFVGPQSMEHMDLIIKYDGENITDIFCCSLLKLENTMELGNVISIPSDFERFWADLEIPPNI